MGVRRCPSRTGRGPGLIQLHIVARGRIGRSAEGDLVDRYLKRIAWPVKVTELPDQGGRTLPVASGTKRVLLDEKGEMLGSVAFAQALGRWRDEGAREARFEIGAADGFDDADRAGADIQTYAKGDFRR